MTADPLDMIAKVAVPVAAGAWALGKFVVPYASRAAHNMRSFTGDMRAAASDVKAIKKEVFPNGGSSLSDRVDATRNELRSLRFEVTATRRVQRRALDQTKGVALFECDYLGQCTWVSAQWTAWTGLSVGEAQGHGWAAAIHHMDRERVFAAWTTAILERRPFAAEIRYAHVRTGLITRVRVDAEAIEAPSGECVGWVGHVVPIPERA